MQASHCAPTPTSRGRCRKVPPKRWAISWHKSCEKSKEKPKSGGENDTTILSAALWTFRRVGRGVGQASSRGFSRSTFPKITQTFLGEILPHKCSKTLISCKNRKAKRVAKTPDIQRISGVLVGEGGFEPPKSLTTDLQSAPFGHSGIPPSVYLTIKDYTALSGKLQVFF